MRVTYIDHMGSDLSVVNAARVSFGKKSEWSHELGEGKPTGASYNLTLSKADQGLIQFLARGCTSGDWDAALNDVVRYGYNIETLYRHDPSAALVEDGLLEDALKSIKNMPTHWTPFGHTAITLHIKAPIFVARQLGKHQVGLVWNEVSRRYVTDDPEFYTPETWRKAAENVKQGSSDNVVTQICLGKDGTQVRGLPKLSHNTVDIQRSYTVAYTQTVELYNEMLASGVCPEQARMVLPQSMYTEWYWTGNLYAFANVFIQRTDSHAQKEVRDVAHQMGEIIEPLFPVSWKALTQ